MTDPAPIDPADQDDPVPAGTDVQVATDDDEPPAPTDPQAAEGPKNDETPEAQP